MFLVETAEPVELYAMRLGVYGGSFDPVHLGHLLVAQAAREELDLDRVVFIPAAQSPFKPSTQPTLGAVRTQMLRLALQGWEWAEVDDRELRRGGISYTVDTLREIAAEHPGAELSYLIGADHAPVLPKWRDADALADLAQFVVIPRPGDPAPFLPAPFRGTVLSGFPLGVSSSRIRDRVKAGLSIRHLVPSAVAEAISANRLYL